MPKVQLFSTQTEQSDIKKTYLHFFERRKYAIIKHMNLKYSFSEAF